MERSAEMTLATTVALVVVRGPVPVAKALGAIDRLSSGRAVECSWPSVRAPRPRTMPPLASISRSGGRALTRRSVSCGALWRPDSPPFVGRFYSTQGLSLEPLPAQAGGPPIWVGSWGSEAGLRRVARLADGWLASAYNTTPELFGRAWQALGTQLADHGRASDTFPNALATMWCYITEDPAEAERVLIERVVPTVHRPEDMLRERLPIGPPELFAEKLTAFAKAGVQRVYIWPVADELNHLDRFGDEVRPLVAAS